MSRKLSPSPSSVSSAEAIRSIFLDPKEQYSTAEAAALLGKSVAHFTRLADAVLIKRAGGAVPTGELVDAALAQWSLAEIERALGSQFEAVFQPLHATELVALPRYVVEWFRTSEAKRLGKVQGATVSLELAVQNALEQDVWGADDAGDEVVNASDRSAIAARVKSRISQVAK